MVRLGLLLSYFRHLRLISPPGQMQEMSHAFAHMHCALTGVGLFAPRSSITYVLMTSACLL